MSDITEEARLEALRRYEILDTPGEPPFDDIARLAVAITGSPIGLIAFFDGDRQWFKAHAGWEVREAPASMALGLPAAGAKDVEVVDDTREVASLANHPLIQGAPPIRSYASAPIVTPDGYAIGSVTTMDHEPRTLNAMQRESLAALARQVATLLELRLMESRRRQSERLESIGHLAGGIAHDFNNLLTVILSNADFASESVDNLMVRGTNDAAVAAQRDIAEVRRAAERASALTRQLLIFSRRDITHEEVLNLGEVIRELELLIRRTIGEHIDVQITLDADLWPVMADRTQIEQMLIALAVNARDAMTRGGTLTISAENVNGDEQLAARFPDMRPGKMLRLTVEDTGVGMSPEVRARAFEPFFSTKPMSSGLGLAAVYGVAKQRGGSIELRSTEGFGTAVSVYLPATEDVAEDTTSKPGARTTDSELILVVEDDDALRHVVARALEQGGFRVLEARGPGEARTAWEANATRIGLVLTDIVMPTMSGPELLRWMRERAPEVGIAYMSGYRPDDPTTLDPPGPLIEKPFTASGLVASVREVLERRASN